MFVCLFIYRRCLVVKTRTAADLLADLLTDLLADLLADQRAPMLFKLLFRGITTYRMNTVI